ncbi:hypothetical protein BDEG_24480 [Batrachochytrium dendrobatidis JEL423]|uniref:Secreted protein n=1 Tax=Batrachochytrium dendrobatidis (strain JEL423) TaxID=403673 RepID=A0A177WL00_BATDL|nr:hypothetical protein BDEG_24480 [Batrachochytrium dendrobatidis JEL423]
MKLAVTVLSSILLAFSVTTASPVNPTATTSYRSKFSSTPIPSGIGLDGLDPLPGNVKELLEKYLKEKHDFVQQEKICDSLQSKYTEQYMLVMNLETKIQDLEEKSQKKGGSPKYNGKIQKIKADLQAQKVKLEDLRKSYDECDSTKDGYAIELSFTEVKLMNIVFGGNWDHKSLDKKFALIEKHSSVKTYLKGLRGKGTRNNSGDQQKSQEPSDQQKSQEPSGPQKSQEPSGQQKNKKPSGQQKSQEPQPSPDTSSGSGSSGQKAPSNKRKRVFKFVGEIKSLFKRPKYDDSSN